VSIDDFIFALTPVKYVTVTMLVMMYVCVPITIFMLGIGWVFLAQIAVLYLLTVGALVWVWLKKDVLQISNKFYFGIASDSLLCIPFAINLARKISLKYTWQEESLQFAKRTFEKNKFEALLRALMKRVDRSIKVSDKGSGHRDELKEYQKYLQGMK